MNPVVKAVPRRTAKLLAVISVACFWLLPLSPVIAIGAVSMNEGASGWPHNLAVTGAVLCTAYTLLMALVIANICLQMSL